MARRKDRLISTLKRKSQLASMQSFIFSFSKMVEGTCLELKKKLVLLSFLFYITYNNYKET